MVPALWCLPSFRDLRRCRSSPMELGPGLPYLFEQVGEQDLEVLKTLLGEILGFQAYAT